MTIAKLPSFAMLPLLAAALLGPAGAGAAPPAPGDQPSVQAKGPPRPAGKPAARPAAKPSAALPPAVMPLPVLLAAASFIHGDGSPAGMARIFTAGGHATIVIDLSGIPPGPHGLHLHTTGKCDGPGFTTAGGHLNPTGRQHGVNNPSGSHLGDLPNLTADAAGRISARIHFGGDPQALATALFDADGSALVLHAAADDYKTDPAGNSGARIACGVLDKG
jgi:Cu-Zn family superoxide dismutase